MNIIATDLVGVLVLEPRVLGDARGFFMQLYQADRYGPPSVLMQDNLSRSAKGVLRVPHIQNPNAQGKLVTVLTDGWRWCITPRERIAGRTWQHALPRRPGSKWNQKSCVP